VRKCLGKVIALLALCLCLNGCIAAAAAYGVSRHQTHKSYNEYVASMEQTNQERKNQGLEPAPVDSFEQWKQNRKNK